VHSRPTPALSSVARPRGRDRRSRSQSGDFATEEEALALADRPTYGLCADAYARDLSHTRRVMQRIEAGTVWINRYGRSRDHILSTGGYRASGLGKGLRTDAITTAMLTAL
jgi:aldehyde dehydrogenase (NAD+)